MSGTQLSELPNEEVPPLSLFSGAPAKPPIKSSKMTPSSLLLATNPHISSTQLSYGGNPLSPRVNIGKKREEKEILKSLKKTPTKSLVPSS